MSGLKFLVIFMGILIIVGTSILFTLILLKTQNTLTESHNDGLPITTQIKIEEGSQIVDMSSDQKYLLLKIRKKEDYKIIIMDIFSGKIIKEVILEK